MPRLSIHVMPKMRSDVLPEWANEFVVLTTELNARGSLGGVSERLRVARRGGYCGLDVFLFLLCYFSSGLKIGLRAFSQRCAPYARQLAAVGGRRSWPGAASVSRFLSAVDDSQVEDLGGWLLGEAVGAGAVEAHRSIVCRDTHGASWQVFDYDPTVTTLRHRALPVGEDLPEPERRCAAMAAKGYPGRKRGDVQFSRATLQHAGSGLWVALSMHPGNGNHRDDNERAFASARAWCERTGANRERVVVRSDGGAGGSVPAMSACHHDAGIGFVTRLARYELLEHEQIKERLSRACWLDVEDSLSGPKREASELGTVLLSADHKTVRKNGEPFASIEVRIVISRTPLGDATSKRGAGVAKDGWWYELFGTDLSASSWPAPETVSLYYGRSGQENRFCQEDRELGLDRIFSYHLPGQHLANLVGLFVWNLRLARGADLVRPMPDKLPEQPPRVHASSLPTALPAEALPPTVASPATACDDGADAASQSQTEAEVSPAEDKSCLPVLPPPPKALPPTVASPATACDDGADAASQSQVAAEVSPAEDKSCLPVLPPPPEMPVGGQAVPSTIEKTPDAGINASPATESSTGSLPEALAALANADWNAHLTRLPGWQWDDRRGLVCPQGKPLRLHKAEKTSGGALLLRWRARVSSCRDCPERPACSKSLSPKFKKEVWMTLEPNATEPIAELCTRAQPASATHSAAVASGKRSGSRTSWRPTPGEDNPGALSIAWPTLIPSELRHYFRSECRGVEIEVTVEGIKRTSPRNPFYLATDAAERQQRRRTWTWRHARNKLPNDVHVDIAIHGGKRLARLLAGASPALIAA